MGIVTDGQIIKDPTIGTVSGDISVLGGDLWILEKGSSPTYYTKFATGDQSADVSYVLPTAQGAASTYLKNDGSGNLSWATVTTYAGSDTHVMYNDGGTALGGDANFTWTKTTYTLQLRQPANDAVGVPLVFLKSRSGTGAAGQDGDDIAVISFKSYDDTAVTPVLTEYARMMAEITDASDSTEDGQIVFSGMVGGTLTEVVRIGYTKDAKANDGVYAGMHLRGASGGGDSPVVMFSTGADSPYDRGSIYWNQRDKRMVINASRTNCATDVAGIEFHLWNDSLGGVILHGLETTHVNFGFFNMSAVDSSCAFGTSSHNTVQIKNIGVCPTVVAADQAGFCCKDYAAGDARLYFFGESTLDHVIVGAGDIVQLDNTNDANGPTHIFHKSRSGTGAAGQDNDYIGDISFKSYNDAGTPELIEYARIQGRILDATDGDECGELAFHLMNNTNLLKVARFYGTLNNYYWLELLGPSRYSGLKVSDSLGSTSYINIWQNGATNSQVTAWAGGGIGNLKLGGYPDADYYSLIIYSDGNFGFGNHAVKRIGTSGVSVIGLGPATAPTTCPADSVQFWNADYAAGDARLYIMSEGNTNKTIIGKGGIELLDIVADANALNVLQFMKNRGGNGTAGQDGDDIGIISFKSYDDTATPVLTEYARILAEIGDASNSTEDGKINIYALNEGTERSFIEINGRAKVAGDYMVTTVNDSFCFTTGQYASFGINVDGNGHYSNPMYVNGCSLRMVLSTSMTWYAGSWGTYTHGTSDITLYPFFYLNPASTDSWNFTWYDMYGGTAYEFWPHTGNSANFPVEIVTRKVKRASNGSATLAGAADDRLAIWKMQGYDAKATPEDTVYVQLEGRIVDPTDTSEDGKLMLMVMDAGTLETMLTIAPGGLQISNNPTAPSAILADNIQVWGADYASGDARLYIMGEANTNKVAIGGGKVLWDSSLADHSASGDTHTGICGEALTLGDVCYMKSDGKYYKTDADAESTMPGVVLCLATTALPTGGANVTTTQSTKKYAGTGLGTGYQVVGDIITFSGFSNGDSNGAKTIATIGSGEITVSEAIGADESGVAVTWTENDATCEFLSRGFFRDDSLYNLTKGGRIYCDTTTAGAVTQTAPSGASDVVQCVGYAYTADIIFFNPQLVQSVL